MITTDPELVRGGQGYAWRLVDARLSLGIWPLYKNTRNRKQMKEGDRLAFYVGGSREYHGTIVATATIAAKNDCRGPIDPDRYLTDFPNQTLILKDVERLEDPVDFRSKLDDLSFKPKNMTKWGIVLMGGCRSLQRGDWDSLFSADRK